MTLDETLSETRFCTRESIMIREWDMARGYYIYTYIYSTLTKRRRIMKQITYILRLQNTHFSTDI